MSSFFARARLRISRTIEPRQSTTVPNTSNTSAFTGENLPPMLFLASGSQPLLYVQGRGARPLPRSLELHGTVDVDLDRGGARFGRGRGNRCRGHAGKEGAHQIFTHGPVYSTGPVGAAVGDPPDGSRLIARRAASPSDWSATVFRRSVSFSRVATRPSDRGDPPGGNAHSSRLLPGTAIEASSIFTIRRLELRLS